MITKIVKIGNSRGIRIPKTIFEQLGLSTEVELEVKEHELVVKPIQNPRKGWDKAFERMAGNGDDHLLDRESLPGESSWDDQEWEW